MALVHPLGHLVAELGGKNPVVPMGFDERPEHGFRRARGVHIGGIEEVDAVLVRMRDDSLRLPLFGLVTEHHGAQAQGGDLEIAAAKISVLHGRTVCGLVLHPDPQGIATAAKYRSAPTSSQESQADHRLQRLLDRENPSHRDQPDGVRPDSTATAGEKACCPFDRLLLAGH